MSPAAITAVATVVCATLSLISAVLVALISNHSNKKRSVLQKHEDEERAVVLRRDITEEIQRHQAQIDTQIAVIDTKISNLTEEVRKHNNFAQRMPVVEEQIKVANNRIKDLEVKVG